MNNPRLVLALVLAILCAPKLRLSAQSDVAFPPEVYAARRARLAAQTGDALVIVPGRYSIGDEDLYKQDPNFWYLTGVESPYAILVIVPFSNAGPSAQRAPRAVLFLPEKYQFASAQYPMEDEAFRRAVWNRPVRRLAPGKEASAATGIAETYPLDDFAVLLTQLAAGRTTIYLPLDNMKLYSPAGLATPVRQR